MSKAESLHSRYNPRGEAERYINSLALNNGADFFILIEPGMGYMVNVIRNKFPKSKIIALHAEPPGINHEENQPDAFWHPETGLSLGDFLEQHIPDTEAGAIKIIEWRPSVALYGETYRFLLSETAKFIKQADASARTVKQFGRRWLKNFFKNLTLITEAIYPLPFSFPLVITGAGPSLEDTIPIIRKNRTDFLLLAASSSAAALKAAKAEPDLVISTDGGNWALLHLFECFRPAGKLRLAFSLNAALPSQCKNAELLIISDGSLWQDLVLRELNIPFIVMPQRGTVSAAALDLGFALTDDTIYLTGLDLSHKDIQTHVKPYGFDKLWEEKAGLFNPCYSQTYKRSFSMHAGGSHSVYASWFSRQIAAYPKRLRSLGSNNAVFNSLKSTMEIRESKKTKRPVFKTVSLRFDENPAKQALSILKTALTNPLYEAKLKEELLPLTYPVGIDAFFFFFLKIYG
jgi:hypothetical protein